MIFNELEYAETMLSKGFIQNKYLTELRILAKYYNKIKELKTEEVKVMLKEFCKKFLLEYNEVIHLDMINKAVNYGVKKKHTLTVILSIHITKNELNKIQELNDLKLEKIAFTVLVLSKANKYKPKNKYNNGDFYTVYNYKELFKYAGVKCSKDQKDDYLKQLSKSRLFNYTIYGGLRVNFIDDMGDIGDSGIVLSNFNNFVLEYEKYVGGNVINCEKCGIPFYPKSNNQKYCVDCWPNREKELWRENKRKTRNVQV